MIDSEEYKERFNEIMSKVECNFIPVTIPPNIVDKCNKFAKDMQVAKSNEIQHQKDNGKRNLRQSGGKITEAAVANWLWCDNSVDYTIGDSSNYVGPDLKIKASFGMVDLYIKSSAYGTFPLVKPNPSSSEIICLRKYEGKKIVVLICGLATVDVLKQYTSKDYVKSPNVNPKLKIAFYGYKHLHFFKNRAELGVLIKKFGHYRNYRI